MFIDFSSEKSLTLKQKLWKALKSGTNHLYTTNIHSRGAQTGATFLMKGSVAGSWAVHTQHLLSSVATTGHTMPSLWSPGTHLSAAGRSRAHTPCRAVLARCQWHSDLLECIKLRTCQDLANRSLQADPWMRWVSGWDLRTRFGLQDWATRESAAPFRDFIFFLCNCSTFPLDIGEQMPHLISA